MSVVGVHGVGQHQKGAETLASEWGPALRDRAEGTGAWPGSAQRWVNISDDGEVVVALQKRLDAFFDRDSRKVLDIAVDNGATDHDVKPYLTARDTEKAIADGLD